MKHYLLPVLTLGLSIFSLTPYSFALDLKKESKTFNPCVRKFYLLDKDKYEYFCLSSNNTIKYWNTYFGEPSPGDLKVLTIGKPTNDKGVIYQPELEYGDLVIYVCEATSNDALECSGKIEKMISKPSD